MNTKELYRKTVWRPKPKKNKPDAVKKMGRIHHFVFHPSRAQLLGFMIKRPDIALMFHRRDAFIPFNGFVVIDGDIVVKEDVLATGREATKTLGVNLESCVIWIGLPILCADGTSLGFIDEVEFDFNTGDVVSLGISDGATSNVLLGRRVIPGSLVRGFKRGMGTQLYLTDDDDPESYGCILVADEARDIEAEGGIAKKAGEATATVTNGAKRTYEKVSRKVKPALSDASKAAGEAIRKGVYATGRQIARTEGMFTNFKSEFKKAMNDDE